MSKPDKSIAKPLITLCMIVKDEARDLPRCLQSVQGIVDQLIIVDTGSKDATVAIARKYGAIVVRSEWTGDFAAARNKGLARANGEWVLFLDADEELDEATGMQLRLLAQEPEITAYFLNIWNYMSDGRSEGATINPVLRMFRNDPRYRFEGRIHEQIAGPITQHTPQARFHLSDVIIHHYGYKREVVAAKNKLQRNRTLLEQAIKEDPDNRFHWYNLGVEYFRGGEVEEAVGAFRRAREGINYASVSYAHLLVKHEVHGLQALRRWQEALALLEESLVWYSDYPDLWHAKGVSLAVVGRWRRAAEAFAAAIHIGRAPAIYHTEDGMGTYQSAYWLGSMHEAELDYETAAHWYAEAVRYRGSLLLPLQRLCHMMRIAGSPEQLAAFASERFTVDSPQAAVKLAGIMLNNGCYGATQLWLDNRLSLAAASDEERAALLPWKTLAAACVRMEEGLGPEETTDAGGQTLVTELAAAASWLGGAEDQRYPAGAVHWLPLLLRSSETMREKSSVQAEGAIEKVRAVIGQYLDLKPPAAFDGSGSEKGIRASVQALCGLADYHLSRLQHDASMLKQAAASIRLLLPAGSEHLR
ncbi:glycosyltransferase [Paenibacillus sp. CF384]|uniref:glycosyltransferase n=1 Tax=Paenibacillus sp. CF384 TaxID=1884382 RepID=UPI000896A3D8|nr:glycosyltransferase [Paenibacillus sp. CF384]SDX95575.1 Glycosyltransferase involved in cell wall bisynthesis [Paenibacillus sp. CF384]